MDAHYTVLARRFRPQTFEQVVGQERIARGLQNAIRAGRVAHAYLFTGARGVGKTSMARILAKALNCPSAVDGVPCNECDLCSNISTGRDVDVSEIDGASNRGIDDIRALRANVNVKSMRTRYKVYIIDEVHMLTKEAFNALLKTLEEPPPNVKFVFCTTEPNKVPDTILSRCQRFDFSTVETESIAGRLEQIAQAEGVEVEPEAVRLVARRAAGSMRDSQSLFDQLLAFGGERITAGDVHTLLGTATDDRLLALVDALIERRRDAALVELQAALHGGVQLDALTDQLVSFLRDLMVLACGAREVALLSVGEEHRQALAVQAERWGLQTITAALQIMADAKARMQRVTFGQPLAELALIRISLLEELDRLDEMLAELKANSGAGQARSAASRPSRSPRTSSPQPVAAQKKNDEAPLAVAQPEPPSGPLLEFQPGVEKELFSQLVNSFQDMLRNHLLSVSRTAIVGPNELELSFPKSYDLSRSYCSRADNLTRLQREVARLTGRQVTIRIAVVADESQDSAPPRKTTRKTALDKQSEPPSDPLVSQAISIFGVTSWRVQELPAAPVPEE